MAAIVCPNCGTTNEERYAFCEECGTALPRASVATVLRSTPEEMPTPLRTVAPLVDLDSIETLTGSMPQASFATQLEDGPTRGGSGPLGGVRLQPIVGSVDSPPRPTIQPDSPSTMVFGAELPDASSEEGGRDGSTAATPRLRPLVDVGPQSLQTAVSPAGQPQPVVQSAQPPVQPSSQWPTCPQAPASPVPVPPVVEPAPAPVYSSPSSDSEPDSIPETIVVSAQSREPQVLKSHPGVSDDEDPDSPTLIFDEAYTVRLTRRNDGQVYEFDLPAMVGKGTKADVMISGNRYIGRLHAKLEVVDDEPFITDNDSSNGTFINEARLERGGVAHLADGDIIRLANEEFEFSIA